MARSRDDFLGARTISHEKNQKNLKLYGVFLGRLPPQNRTMLLAEVNQALPLNSKKGPNILTKPFE